MDPLTHTVLGTLVVRAAPSRVTGSGRITPLRAALLGAISALFPDIDYLTFWLDPLSFLAEWHRGPTHSLLLAPLWAVALGWCFSWLLRDRDNSPLYVGICLLGVCSHIAGDLLTIYGTQLLAPLSTWRPGWGITFVIDPWFSAIVSAGVLASFGLKSVLAARTGLLLLLVYLGFQGVLQQRATAIGERYARSERLEQTSSHAMAQPLSPFNWLIIVPEGEGYHLARVNLAAGEGRVTVSGWGWLGRLWNAYQSPVQVRWERYSRYGTTGREQALARAVWRAGRFAKFRRFARYPALYRVDRGAGESCVWFTDLRYQLPGLTPPFRYGMCGTGGIDQWRVYRLKRSARDQRQALEQGG